MRISYIDYADKFEKQFKKLPSHIKDLAEKRELIFREDLFDARLKTHKLHGREKSAWAFWINQAYRVKFVFLSAGGVYFMEIGTHNIYQ